MKTVEIIHTHLHSSRTMRTHSSIEQGKNCQNILIFKILSEYWRFCARKYMHDSDSSVHPDDDVTIRGRETTFVRGKWHVGTSKMRSSIFPLFPVPALGPPFKRPVVSPLPVGEASGYGQLPRLWRNASLNAMLSSLQTGSSSFSSISGLCGIIVNYFLNFLNSIPVNIKVFSFISRLSLVGFRCEAYFWRVGGAVTVNESLIVCFSKIWECSVVA